MSKKIVIVLFVVSIVNFCDYDICFINILMGIKHPLHFVLLRIKIYKFENPVQEVTTNKAGSLCMNAFPMYGS
jgi:hypothetical protein